MTNKTFRLGDKSGKNLKPASVQTVEQLDKKVDAETPNPVTGMNARMQGYMERLAARRQGMTGGSRYGGASTSKPVLH